MKVSLQSSWPSPPLYETVLWVQFKSPIQGAEAMTRIEMNLPSLLRPQKRKDSIISMMVIATAKAHEWIGMEEMFVMRTL